MRSFLTLAWEIFKIFIISLAIIIPIRYFLIQPFFVKGASMEPNYEDGQYLVIDEISYRLRAPERGEVIVFRYPKDPSEFFIKRIIGLPGEIVEVKGTTITIKNNDNSQGFVLDESSYLKSVPDMGSSAFVLGKDEFFVLGDNRAASFDSRRWGAVPRANLIGRVWIRAWPLNALAVEHAPEY